MSRTDLLDTDGENLAVRCFLLLYSGTLSCTSGQMRQHMSLAGWDGYWPAWVNNEPFHTHLTKGGAQDWLRHLFALEPKPATVTPSLKIYTCLGKGGDYERIGTATGAGTMRGSDHIEVYRDMVTRQLYYRTQQDFDNRMAQTAPDNYELCHAGGSAEKDNTA